MNRKILSAALLAAFGATAAHAGGFVNGGFEAGDTTGWTIGGGSRTYTLNPGLDPADLLPGGAHYNSAIANSHSAVVGTGYVDPRLGAALGTTVYSGNYSLRVEDTSTGGYASVANQVVANYTDANIFFAWKAVLLGAHDASEAATMKIALTDVTTGDVLITRTYNAAAGGGGVDPRFSYLNNNYYTPQWQIEQLAIDASRQGHTFSLSVLASDCQPTAHWGYVYLDGFGAVTPPTDTPEPASLALVGLALAGAATARRRAKKA